MVGKSIHDFRSFRLTREEYSSFLAERHETPFQFCIGNKNYWLFENKFYKDTDDLDHESVKALILSRKRLQQDRINRAKTITAAPKIQAKLQRGAIPDDIKQLVWQRDKGRCVKCGSQSELQFDHIIPFSVGGSSAPENLQILCGACNRNKRVSVT
ncbi:MAG: HNH endonuclease signature motif containing protein [Candidatus Berkelbacteria bacterium]